MKTYYAVAVGQCYHGVGVTPFYAYLNARKRIIANMHQVDETLKADPNCQPVTTTPEEIWKTQIYPSLRLAEIPETAYLDFKEHQAKDRWYYTYAIKDACIIDAVDDPAFNEDPDYVCEDDTVAMLRTAICVADAWWSDSIPEEWLDAFLACDSAMMFVEGHPDVVEASEIDEMMSMMRDMCCDAFGDGDADPDDPEIYEQLWNEKCEKIALRLL